MARVNALKFEMNPECNLALSLIASIYLIELLILSGVAVASLGNYNRSLSWLPSVLNLTQRGSNEAVKSSVSFGLRGQSLG